MVVFYDVMDGLYNLINIFLFMVFEFMFGKIEMFILVVLNNCEKKCKND